VGPSSRSTVIDHIKSMKDIEKKTRYEKIIVQLAANDESAHKSHKKTRNCVVTDFLNVVVYSNFPIEKADYPQMKMFVQKHVRNGVSIEESSTIRKKIP